MSDAFFSSSQPPIPSIYIYDYLPHQKIFLALRLGRLFLCRLSERGDFLFRTRVRNDRQRMHQTNRGKNVDG